MLSFIVHIISTHVSLYLTGYRNVGLIEDMSISRDVMTRLTSQSAWRHYMTNMYTTVL